MQKLPENLKRKIKIDENSNCWIWIGAISSKRFGVVKFNKITWKASRLVYTLLIKTITPGMYLLHSCDNPLCVNPSHLREGTQKDNMDDMYTRNRNRHTKVQGEHHYNTKLTANDIINIRSDSRAQTIIAKEYKLCQQTISDIKTKKTWAHL